MINKIILASKSGVRKKILNENGINCEVIPSNIDEDQIKEALLKEKAPPFQFFDSGPRLRSGIPGTPTISEMLKLLSFGPNC